MIKIIHVITDSNIGGAGKVLLNLLSGFDRKKFDMIVVLPEKSLLIPELKALNIRYIELSDIGEKSLSIKGIDKYKKVFVDEKPDIVHTHASFSARIAAKRLKIKVVNTRHSVFDQPGYKKSFPAKNILGYFNNHYSDVIIAVSPAAKDNIVEIGTNPNIVKVVFNGVDKPALLNESEKAAYRHSIGVSEKSFLCAIIARLEEVKGHFYILEAAKLLQDAKQDVIVAVAGTGATEEALRKKALDEGIKNVLFLGFVSDVYKLENVMDLQLNASFGTEATSASLLEGMSLGIPALVSDFGGNPYVIESGVNGLVVPKKNPKAIFDGILKFKENPEFYKICSENSVIIYNERFTVSAMVENTQDVYFSLMK